MEKGAGAGAKDRFLPLRLPPGLPPPVLRVGGPWAEPPASAATATTSLAWPHAPPPWPRFAGALADGARRPSAGASRAAECCAAAAGARPVGRPEAAAASLAARAGGAPAARGPPPGLFRSGVCAAAALRCPGAPAPEARAAALRGPAAGAGAPAPREGEGPWAWPCQEQQGKNLSSCLQIASAEDPSCLLVIPPRAWEALRAGAAGALLWLRARLAGDGRAEPPPETPR
ncbi:unnamed protein product [Prorocentrum cordatum]|uniref:Uncharacterized protein n=1 Tax=Prorocentrum cordatum TaxID=2364126 RepID=A0ABN9XYK7_9DINO|nr:unnamed protein product [Polarella glacialis]